jgi:multiple sugar transport system substrate-binding protein
MNFSVENPTPRASVRRRVRVLIAGAAVLAASALVLSGCSSTGTKASANDSGPQTLTVWHYFSDPNQVKLMTDYATLFQKENPKVKVDNVYVPYDQMDSKLIASAGAKSGPDVVVFNGADADNLALGGTLLPITSQWNSFADKGQFPSSVVHKIGSTIYAAQGYVNLLGLWYNKDILDKIGVTPPTTLAELNTDMAKATAAGYQGITLSGLPNSQGEWQAYPWLTNSGYSYAKNGKAALSDGLSTVKSWIDKGYLSKESTTWDQTVPFQKWAAGGVAFSENGNWQIATAKSTAKFNYGVVPLPISSKGKIYLGGEGEAIGKYSKNPSLAWKYLKATYFDKSAELTALTQVGSIPARTDSAANTAVSGNALLKPFAQSIAKFGANYPDDAVAPKGVNDLQLAVGQSWSAVLGGQQAPDAAASALVTKLQPFLTK